MNKYVKKYIEIKNGKEITDKQLKAYTLSKTLVIMLSICFMLIPVQLLYSDFIKLGNLTFNFIVMGIFIPLLFFMAFAYVRIIKYNQRYFLSKINLSDDDIKEYNNFEKIEKEKDELIKKMNLSFKENECHSESKNIVEIENEVESGTNNQVDLSAKRKRL